MFYSQASGLLLQKPQGVKTFSSEALMGRDKQNIKVLEGKTPNPVFCVLGGRTESKIKHNKKTPSKQKIQKKKTFTPEDLSIRAYIKQYK